MRQKWWALVAVACGTFMATLDASIVNIALTTLTKELHTDLAHVKWVIVIYFLVITTLLLPFGRLSDHYGRKRLFFWGFVTFSAGSGLCGISGNLITLVVSRMIQAIGASMLMANGPAIITSVFPRHELGRALGTLAMVVSIGLISGPSVGGILIGHIGWRSIFLLNIPVGIVGLYLVKRFVPETERPRGKLKFDWLGGLLQFVALGSIILAMDEDSLAFMAAFLGPAAKLVLVVSFVVSLLLFVRVEKKTRVPLFDMSLLKNRTFWTANLASLLIFVAYSSVAVLMPFFLETSAGFSTHRAGLFMTIIPLSMFIIAPISGRLSDHFGSKELCFIGALVSALSLFFMSGVFGSGVRSTMSPSMIVICLCSIGLGMGLFQSPNNNAIMGAVPEKKLGVASALIATLRNMGLVIGAGFVTGFFSWQNRIANSNESALQMTYFVSGVIAIGAMMASLGKKKGPHWRAKAKKS